MNVYLLSGPPRAGKDLTGRLLAQMTPGKAVIAKFASALKVSVHAVLAIMGGADKVAPHDAYENDKDEPCPDFFGAKPRDAYIAMSEAFAKPLFGKKIYGKVIAKQLRDLKAASTDSVIITDCGFAEEVEHLVQEFPDTQFYLVRISRDNCDYGNDSRSTFQIGAFENLECFNIRNTGDLGELRVAVANLLLTLKE